ncbi:hypothetical protein AX17_002672 [Amanita inopinata Kibby_2008]|nr:hypothetical protein AX17_002672 [Amanita inopinata Kibby_2008]
MPLYDLSDDAAFASSNQYHVRRPSSRTAHLSSRKSSATLRKPLTLDKGDDDNDTANGGRSLAHELAVALMPEPSAGSKLLAEELGLEFDEGAEGIDEPVHLHNQEHQENGPQDTGDVDESDFVEEMSGAEVLQSSLANGISADDSQPPELDPEFDSPSTSQNVQSEQKRPDQDMMEILARDLESNARFIGLLQKLDTELTVEQIASDTIRRINETVRDREGQVRELLQYEREFRRIAGEVGGSEALSHLDILENMINEDNASDPRTPVRTSTSRHQVLETLEEEPSLHIPYSQDWEMDPDRNHLGDEEEETEIDASTSRLNFPPPPPLKGPPTPAKTIPQLTHLRTFTSSFVSSLATCSEQAQVNGAGLTDAARKIRSLKNKIGGLYSECDSVEQSKQRVDRWEGGIADGNDVNADGHRSTTPTRSSIYKRVDGRKIVQEHLRAFEVALADASMKTQAIMAR